MNSRITIKISGEFLTSTAHAISINKLNSLASSIKKFKNVSIILGGGNIWRKRDWEEHVSLANSISDNVGMHATIINAYALHGVLNKQKINSVVVNSLVPNVYFNDYQFNEKTVDKLFETNQVIIFAGGTSLPYFSTDMTTILRALQTQSKTIYMCKHGTNGVYDKDPNSHQDAKHFGSLTFSQYLRLGLTVIDAAAIGLCLNQGIKIFVFNIEKQGVNLDHHDRANFTVIHDNK